MAGGIARIIGKIAIKVVPDMDGFRRKLETEADSAARNADVKVNVKPEVDDHDMRQEARRARDKFEDAANTRPVKLEVESDRAHAAREGRKVGTAHAKGAQSELNRRRLRTTVKIDSVSLMRLAKGMNQLNSNLGGNLGKMKLDPKDVDARLLGRKLRRALDDSLRDGLHRLNIDRIDMDHDALDKFRRMMAGERIPVNVDTYYDKNQARKELAKLNDMWDAQRKTLRHNVWGADRGHANNIFDFKGDRKELSDLTSRFKGSVTDMENQVRKAQQRVQLRTNRALTQYRRLMLRNMDVLEKRGRRMQIRLNGENVGPSFRARQANLGVPTQRFQAIPVFTDRSRRTLKSIADKNPLRVNLSTDEMNKRRLMRELRQWWDNDVPWNFGRIQLNPNSLRSVLSDRSRALRGQQSSIFDRREIDGAERSLGRLGRTIEGLQHPFRTSSRSARAFREDVARVNREVNDLANTDRNRIARLGRSLSTFNTRTSRFGDGVGRAFGRGSRNNFLNFFGGLVGGVVNLIPKAIGIIGQLTSAFGTMFDTFKVARAGGAGIFKAGLEGIMAGAKAAAPAILAVVLVLGLLTLAIPALVSGLGALAALLAAMAGSILIALVGALLPLVPILGALGVGFGVVALAFAGMTDKMKKDFTEPIKKSFQGLTRAIKPEMDSVLRTVSNGVASFTRSITPMAKTLMSNVHDILHDFGDKLKDPRQIAHLDAWEKAIPDIFKTMGEAVNSLALGLMNFFTPILPYAQRLADIIKQGADRFLEWTKTAEGATSIADFMKTAWDRASNLWNAIVNLGAALAKVFSFGDANGGGSNFLQWLEDVTLKFRNFMSAPENADKIKNFFTEVKTLGSSLKTVLENVATAFKNLNTPEGRQHFTDVVKGIGDMVKGFDDFMTKMKPVTDAFNALYLAFILLMPGVIGLKTLFDQLATAITAVFDAMSPLAGPLKWIADKIPGLGGMTKSFAGEIEKMKELASQAPSDTAAAMGDTTSPFILPGANMGKGLQNGWTSTISGSMVPQLAGLSADLSATLGDTGSWFTLPGSEAAGGFNSGFTQGQETIAETLRNLNPFAKSQVGDTSTTLTEPGSLLTQGFTKGIKQGKTEIGPEMFKLPTDAKAAVGDTSGVLLPQGRDLLGGFGSGMQQGKTGTVNTELTALGGYITSNINVNTMTLLPAGLEVMQGFAMGIAIGTPIVGIQVNTSMTSMLNTLRGIAHAGTLMGDGMQLMIGFGTGIRTGTGFPVVAAVGVTTATVNAVRGNAHGGTLSGAGMQLMLGLAAGMNSMRWYVIGVATSIANAAAASVRAAMQIHSPSRVFHSIGSYVGQGFGLGMLSEKSQVETSARSLAEVATEAATMNMTNLGRSAGESLASGLSSAAGKVQSAMGGMGGVLGGEFQVAGAGSLSSGSYAVSNGSIAYGNEMAGAPGTGGAMAIEGRLELSGSEAHVIGIINSNPTKINTASAVGGRKKRR